MRVLCRAMTAVDIDAVVAIQAEAYVDEILEPEAIIRARFHAAPECAWVVEVEQVVVGYLVAYQTPLGKLTPWGAEFQHQSGAMNLYVHDLAISVAAQGMGLGPKLLEHALTEARARKLGTAALISVQESQGFWRSLGFAEQSLLDSTQQASLGTYTGPATYMVRSLL